VQAGNQFEAYVDSRLRGNDEHRDVLGIRTTIMKPIAIRSGMFLAALVLVCSALALRAQDAISAVEEAGSRSRSSLGHRGNAEENANRRLREGTLLTNQGGYFRQDGDGAIFVTEEKLEFVALNNLNLERVVRTLKGSDEAESIRWSVNGVVTEFNGRNFLLISRAVYKSASPPPVPEQILN